MIFELTFQHDETYPNYISFDCVLPEHFRSNISPPLSSLKTSKSCYTSCSIRPEKLFDVTITVDRIICRSIMINLWNPACYSIVESNPHFLILTTVDLSVVYLIRFAGFPLFFFSSHSIPTQRFEAFVQTFHTFSPSVLSLSLCSIAHLRFFLSIVVARSVNVSIVFYNGCCLSRLSVDGSLI